MTGLWPAAALAHLTLAALWLGSMGYSLAVVQPRLARLFPDPVRREELLLALAQGNRWPVVGLVAGLLGTGGAVVALAGGAVTAGYAVALGCHAVAATLFGYVSWRHWPARVFALPAELPGYQRRLRLLAAGMTGLVAAGFLAAAGVTAAGA